MKLFSHEVAQKQWARVDYHRNISLVGLLQRQGYKEIVAIGTYADDGSNRAEVAFVVREDMQGLGIGTQLLAQLESIAKENGFIGFTATVLNENETMLHIFKQRYPDAQIHSSGGGEMLVKMDFAA